MSEPHKIAVRVWLNGRYADIHWNPETSTILRECPINLDGSRMVGPEYEEIMLRNEIK